MNTARLTWETFEAPTPTPERRSAVIEEFRHDEALAEAPPPDPEAERDAEITALDAMLARARGEGRAEGFERGAATAEAAFIAERRLILADIRERIADADLLRQRSDAAACAALRALAEALISSVAPALAGPGLAAEIADAVAAAHDALTRERGKPHIEVRAPGDRLAEIRVALDDAGLVAALTADATLGALEAQVIWGDGVDAINLSACLDAAHQAIRLHFDNDEELRAHG
jgi:hypothetical protein